MYIYLSERKRRTFLSLPLPQNLSPKKLSPKDQRFLQKNLGNITVPLSLPLIKQQKKLYEKHIRFCLNKGLSPFDIHIMDKRVNLLSQKPTVFGKGFQPPLCISLWQKCEKYKSISLKQKKYPELYRKPFSLYAEKLQPSKPTPKENYKLELLQSIGTLSEKISPPFQKKRVNIKGQKHCYEKSHMGCSLGQLFLYNALCIYTQTVKVKQKSWAPTFYGKRVFGKGYNDLLVEKGGIIKNCLHFPQKVPDILQKFACPPLFVNGQNQYPFCRFLYNREHIKLSISPQMVLNQKVNQKVAKTKGLHEKKKIALFYGQIAKKDLAILSKKAQSLPGGFEENMYTLLESRIDVCIHRAGFSKTIAMARQLIREGVVFVNGKPVFSCKVLGKPGDIVVLRPEKKNYISVCYKDTTKSLYNSYTGYFFKKNIHYGRYNKQHKVSMETTKEQRYKEKALRSLWQYNYLHSTSPLSSKFFLEKRQQTTRQAILNPGGLYGYLATGFFLYKSLCKKTCPKVFPEGVQWQKNTQKGAIKPGLNGTLQSLSFNKGGQHKPSREVSIFLNTYIASHLKYKCKTRNSFKVWKEKENIFTPVMKSIQNANCAFFWGQKPLNLEISHKTACFIYLYPPQKIISPICIDFSALKF